MATSHGLASSTCRSPHDKLRIGDVPTHPVPSRTERLAPARYADLPKTKKKPKATNGEMAWFKAALVKLVESQARAVKVRRVFYLAVSDAMDPDIVQAAVHTRRKDDDDDDEQQAVHPAGLRQPADPQRRQTAPGQERQGRHAAALAGDHRRVRVPRPNGWGLAVSPTCWSAR